MNSRQPVNAHRHRQLGCGTATVERLGNPFAVRWRIRCGVCRFATQLCVSIGVALDIAADHFDVHRADARIDRIGRVA